MNGAQCVPALNILNTSRTLAGTAELPLKLSWRSHLHFVRRNQGQNLGNMEKRLFSVFKVYEIEHIGE